MKNWQNDLLHLLQTADGEQQIFKLILSFAKELEFDFCAYGLKTRLPVTNPKCILINNYELEWQTSYRDNNYISIDPTVEHGMKSPLPVVWTEELFENTTAFWEEAKSYRLSFGWALAVHDINGISSMLSLARSHDALTESELEHKLPKMNWLTHTTHAAMSRCMAPKLLPESNVLLSDREVAVLRWTADGKTSSEIADILNITERTVNFHINNAVGKLNASNKAAATIKAALLGKL